MSAPKMIVLKSSDDETFEIEESVALQSQTIKNMIETDCDVNTIPLPNVTSQILAKIIVYCKRHDDASNKSSSEGIITNKSAEDDLKAFDAEFLKVDQDTLFDLILAANYLDIKGLLNLTCENVANMMKGKTPDEIRETFHIKNDYTPEEEEEIRRENSWAFE